MTNTTTTRATETTTRNSERHPVAKIALQTAAVLAERAQQQAERTSEKIRVGK